MSDPNNPNLSLADTITQFQTDAGLAHQFTNGGPTDVVVGAGGTYPSLAKIAADSEATLDTVLRSFELGIAVRTYQFSSRMQVDIKHGMNTTNFSVSIVNAEGVNVTAPITVVDANEFIIEFTEEEAGLANVIFYQENQNGVIVIS